MVLEVFEMVLGTADVAETDHFFDNCGGTSVQAWWALSEMQTRADASIEFEEFVRSPTARDVGAVLFASVRDGSGPGRGRAGA